MSKNAKQIVVVVGAGLGGLSAAIRLAAAGFRVTVLEQQEKPGGKLQRIEHGGYRFDRGPSTITMPARFEQVFASAGRDMRDYVTLYPLVPATRNVFADGSIVDLVPSQEEMASQIARYSARDAANYPAFCKEAERLYRLSEANFLSKPLEGWKAKANPHLLLAFGSIRPLTTLGKLLRRYFQHPNTLALFGRYATYVGASPYEAPAIFAMLAHVEASLGIYGVKGGTYALVEAFVRLAEELGVTIRCKQEVQHIIIKAGEAVGVRTAQGELPADAVIVNGDVLTAYDKLLPSGTVRPGFKRKLDKLEPSLSGYVQLLGIKRTYEQLLHHTVYFPEQYGSEFTQIFKDRRAPTSPAIYICNTAFSEADAAPPGASSLFILVNAPYLSANWSWAEEAERYGEQIVQRLERSGLVGLSAADFRYMYTPEQLHADTSAYRGAIYGISSNSPRQTFFRPGQRAKGVAHLWFAGGTTHPGGGTPIVVQSGQLVAEQIIAAYS